MKSQSERKKVGSGKNSLVDESGSVFFCFFKKNAKNNEKKC